MNLGKVFIFIGIVFILIGIIWAFFSKLPGDFSFRKGNVSFHFPLMTSIIVSIILTLLFFIFSKFR